MVMQRRAKGANKVLRTAELEVEGDSISQCQHDRGDVSIP